VVDRGRELELNLRWFGAVLLQLVQKLSGERASVEQTRRLAREIAAENDVLLDFPEEPTEVRQVQVGCGLHELTTCEL
jgi:plasmid stabilization system protein ParE